MPGARELLLARGKGIHLAEHKRRRMDSLSLASLAKLATLGRE